MKEKAKKQVEHAKEKRAGTEKKIYTEIDNVIFVGLDEIDKDDVDQIKKLIHDHYYEIERLIQSPAKIKIHFKTYKHQGMHKYSVNLMIDFAGRQITADHIAEPARWDAVAAVHQVLDNAIKELTHKFKTETSYKKGYY